MSLERIADALERIAAALEVRNESDEQYPLPDMEAFQNLLQRRVEQTEAQLAIETARVPGIRT